MSVMHVVIYSGGLDSYTLLNLVLQERVGTGDGLLAVSFNYNQTHKKELGVARQVCAELDIPHMVLPLTSLQGMRSALTDSNQLMPEGPYDGDNMKQTVVPGRNTVMLATAMAIAEDQVFREKYQKAKVYYGAHAGDHHIYPDCRPGFFGAMNVVMGQATEYSVSLEVPFGYADKADILAKGLSMEGLDYGKTWTCYKGQDEPCGLCGSCTERAAAFAALGVADPLLTK